MAGNVVPLRRIEAGQKIRCGKIVDNMLIDAFVEGKRGKGKKQTKFVLNLFFWEDSIKMLHIDLNC